jgi:hypothetical protein
VVEPMREMDGACVLKVWLAVVSALGPVLLPRVPNAHTWCVTGWVWLQLYGSKAADLRVTNLLDVVGILDLSTTTEEYATVAASYFPKPWKAVRNFVRNSQCNMSCASLHPASPFFSWSCSPVRKRNPSVMEDMWHERLPAASVPRIHALAYLVDPPAFSPPLDEQGTWRGLLARGQAVLISIASSQLQRRQAC